MHFTINQHDLLLGLATWPFVWFWCKNQVLQSTIDVLYGAWLTSKGPDSPWLGIAENIYNALSCEKCLSFWSILFITANPSVAMLFALAISKINYRD